MPSGRTGAYVVAFGDVLPHGTRKSVKADDYGAEGRVAKASSGVTHFTRGSAERRSSFVSKSRHIASSRNSSLCPMRQNTSPKP